MEQLVHQGKYHNSKQVCTALRTLGENRNIMIFFVVNIVHSQVDFCLSLLVLLLELEANWLD